MAFFNFVDQVGPAVPASYLNALDNIRNAMSANTAGNITIAAPSSGVALVIGNAVGSPSLQTSGAITVAAGGITVTAGGVIVSAGGVTITLGGLTVSAGGAAITGNSTIAGTLATGAVTITVATAGTAQTWTDGTVSTQLDFSGTASNFGTTSAHSLVFKTGGTSRAVITNAGNITMAAPTSGATLAITGVASTVALTVTAPTATAISAAVGGVDTMQMGVDTESYLAANGTVAIRVGGMAAANDRVKFAAADPIATVSPASGQRGIFISYAAGTGASNIAFQTSVVNGQTHTWRMSQSGIVNLDLQLLATTGVFSIINGGVTGFQMNAAGNLLFPTLTTAAGTALAAVTGSGNLVVLQSSSLRYKKDVLDLDAVTAEKLYSLRPVTYVSRSELDDPNTRYLGLIAEEVYTVLPELVQINGDKQVESLDYARITVLLIRAVQELRRRLDYLSPDSLR